MKAIDIFRNYIKKLLRKIFKRKTFKYIAYEWLEYKRNSIKDSTYCNYLFIIEKYLNPEYEDKRITKIRDYNNFIHKLEKTLSAKYIRDITNIFKAILTYYEETYDKKVNQKRISLPKIEKKNLKILSEREKRKLEKYCIQNDNIKLLGIIMSLNTGMRIGEICALKWENIDMENKSIYVKNTLQRVYDKKAKKSKIIIGTPKSTSSVRAIPINKKLYEILEPLKKKYKKEAYFLTGMEDKYIEPRNYQRFFEDILKVCKIKKYNFHILRHTMASNCIEIGMDIKTLSEILGHSNVQITLNRYVHTSKKLMKKYLEKL